MSRHLLTAIALVLALAANGWGYQRIGVEGGGVIKGRVVAIGNIPRDETVEITRDNQFCGDTLPREKYVIGGDGGVRHAVVFIKEIKAGKPLPTTSLEIDNIKCAFVPHVQAGVKGQELIIKNSDPMLHNTHLYLDRKTVFNFALPIPGLEIKKPLKEAGLMRVECDAHPWMKAYIYLVDHPYIAVTDENGAFALDDVPPGRYELKVWHEALGEREQAVTVPAAGVAELRIEFKR